MVRIGEKKRVEGLMKWDELRAKVDTTQMNAVERDFIFRSVRYHVLQDVKLSEKQRAWLCRLIRKYPAAPTPALVFTWP